MNLRRTVLRDLDGTVHFVPHSHIDTASNWTKGFSRVNLNIAVAYDTDLDHAIEVINRVGKEMAEDPLFAKTIKDPPHVLRVDNLGDSWIELKVIGDTMPIEQWAVMGELRLRIKKAFDAEGFVNPFPQRTLHLKTAEALMRDGARLRFEEPKAGHGEAGPAPAGEET
jgi:small conductance mechanosensitive channel